MMVNQYLNDSEAWWVTLSILFSLFLVISATSLFFGYSIAHPNGRERRWLVAVIPITLSGWAALAISVSITRELDFSGLQSLAFAPILIGGALCWWHPISQLIGSIPTHWLVWMQTYRIFGILFFYPYYTEGLLTGGFAWPAAWGDFATGVTAPIVGWLIWKNPARWAWLFYTWTVFGIADLIVAPLSAFIFGFEVESLDNVAFAIAAIPLFLDPPFGIFIHIVTWRSFSLQSNSQIHK